MPQIGIRVSRTMSFTGVESLRRMLPTVYSR
jgi:hypothetical protein